MLINDKVAIVTGAAGGIGAAVAQRLLEAYARGVLLTDLDAARLDETVQRLAESHGERVAGRAGTPVTPSTCAASSRRRRRASGPSTCTSPMPGSAARRASTRVRTSGAARSTST